MHKPRFSTNRFSRQIKYLTNSICEKYIFFNTSEKRKALSAFLFALVYRNKRYETAIKMKKSFVPNRSVCTPLSKDYHAHPRSLGDIFAYIKKKLPAFTRVFIQKLQIAMEETNIAEFRLGYREFNGCGKIIDAKLSEFYLNPINEWNWKKITKDPEQSLRILLEIQTLQYIPKPYNHNYREVRKFKEENECVIKDPTRLWDMTRAYWDRNKKKYKQGRFMPFHYEEASIEKREEIRFINAYLEYKDLEKMKYVRQFLYNEKNYGRLTSPINLMKKKYRNVLIDHYDYVECDFDAFNPNVLSLYLTGKKFNSDPYLKIVDSLFKFVKYNGSQKDREIYRKAIKSICLTVSGAKSINEAKACIRTNFLRHDGKNGLGLWGKRTYAPSSYQQRIDLAIRTGELTSYNKDLFHKQTFSQNIKWLEFLKENEFPENTTLIRINEKDLIYIILNTLPEISKLAFSNMNGFCQNIESNISVRIAELMIMKDQIPILIHDAFLVKKEFSEFFNTKKEEFLIEEVSKANIKYTNYLDDLRKYELLVSKYEEIIRVFMKSDDDKKLFQSIKNKITFSANKYFAENKGKYYILEDFKEVIRKTIFKNEDFYSKVHTVLYSNIESCLDRYISNNDTLHLRNFYYEVSDLFKRELIDNLDQIEATKILYNFNTNFFLYLFYKKLVYRGFSKFLHLERFKNLSISKSSRYLFSFSNVMNFCFRKKWTRKLLYLINKNLFLKKFQERKDKISINLYLNFLLDNFFNNLIYFRSVINTIFITSGGTYLIYNKGSPKTLPRSCI